MPWQSTSAASACPPEADAYRWPLVVSVPKTAVWTDALAKKKKKKGSYRTRHSYHDYVFSNQTDPLKLWECIRFMYPVLLAEQMCRRSGRNLIEERRMVRDAERRTNGRG